MMVVTSYYTVGRGFGRGAGNFTGLINAVNDMLAPIHGALNGIICLCYVRERSMLLGFVLQGQTKISDS